MGNCTICGSNKIENKDLMLCATHNKARMKLAAPKEVKKPKPINPISDKNADAKILKAAAYAIVDARPQVCATCGISGVPLDKSHVVPVGQYKIHEGNAVNILLECRPCHEIWEHDKPEAKRIQQRSWPTKMLIMQLLQPDYYQQFIGKHGD